LPSKKELDFTNLGQPKKTFDKIQFEKLCAMQATLEEIAVFFDMSEDTVERRCKELYKTTFADIFKQKRKIGFISIRRRLFEHADKFYQANIYLSKNYLGLRDTWDIDIPNLGDKLDAFINAVRTLDTKTD